MKQDNIIDNLPSSRKEIIRYLIKYRFKDLLKILLLVVPFFLPIFIYFIYTKYYLYDFVNNKSEVLNYILMNNFPLMFLIALYGIGLSGVYYSIRRLVFGETLKIKYHFFKGIKESGFEFGLFTMIFYIFYSILEYFDLSLYINFLNNEINPFLYFIILILIISTTFFLLYLLTYILCSCSLYVVSFMQAIKDGIVNVKINFFNNIPLFLLGIFPVFLIYFHYNSSFEIMNIVGMALILFYSNLFGPLFQASYVYDNFDITINKKEYKNYYRIGLKEEDELNS